MAVGVWGWLSKAFSWLIADVFRHDMVIIAAIQCGTLYSGCIMSSHQICRVSLATLPQGATGTVLNTVPHNVKVTQRVCWEPHTMALFQTT